MKKINIIKENKEFERIIKSIRPIRSNLFNIYLEIGNFSYYKFGFSVSKKVGPAVTRNKIKRQLKSIIDKNIYQKKFNCIIIVKREILTADFLSIENELNNILNRLTIIKGDTNEEKNH